jgi:uncharacterized membrane protein HdeD (DUF308 family)
LQKLEENPPWLRMLQIVLGGICIILSLVIILYIGPAVFSIIIILSIILLVIGIERIAIGIINPRSGRSRLVSIGIGLLIIGVSIVLMQFPIFTLAILILLGAIALLLSGISRIVHGIRGGTAGRSKALQIGVGILSIGISILVMIHPVNFGLPLLGVIISIAFLVSGIEMMAVGITGRPRDRIIS